MAQEPKTGVSFCINQNTTSTTTTILANQPNGITVTSVKVVLDGIEEEFVVTPQKIEEDGKTKYVYGLEFEHTIKRGFFEAIKYGFKEFGNITKQMVLSFKLLFKGSVGVNQLSGPVGIYSIVDEHIGVIIGQESFISQQLI